MKKIMMIWVLQVLCLHAGAQDKLKGKIIDAQTQEPLAGAIIKVKQPAQTTLTNSEGLFELKLPKGSYQLQVQYLGFGAKDIAVEVPWKRVLEIELNAQDNQLSEVEVVNTGYQTLPKERAAGSFSLVDNKTFNQQIGTDVLGRLEGITPTLSVDRRTATNPIMMVRGLSTLRGDRTPLIILDDFPYSGDWSNINPNDVENITILKDAAAASIWGAKAGNGVIVISTKKGKYDKKLEASFNASNNVSSLPSLNEYNNLSSVDAIAVERELFAKGYYTSQENSSSRIPLSPAVELMIAHRDGKLSADALSQRLDEMAKQDIRRNYTNAFLNHAYQQQYSLGLRGGNAKTNWYLFSGYDGNRTELGARFERINLRVDNSFRLGDRLDIGTSLYLTKSDQKNGKINLSAMSTSNGFLPAYTEFADENGNALAVMKNYRESYLATLGGGNLLDWNYYPLREGDLVNVISTKWGLLGNIRLNYKVLKGLKLGLNYQFQRQQGNNRTVYDAESYYTRNLINQFTQLSGATVTRPVPMGNIYDDGEETIVANNLRVQANYDDRFGNFGLNALAGGELRDVGTDSKSWNTYGVDGENLKTVAVDYVNPYRNIVTGRNAYIPYGNGYSGFVSRYVSAYVNAALDYKTKYILSASVRRDASNVFGVATNDLWNPLWSVGAAWLLSEESFAKSRYLSYAKLRFSYGSSGNSDGKRAALTTIVYNGTSTYTRTPYANFSNYANPNLKWETVNTLNMGADLKWFNHRVSLSLDYYLKRSYDLIENAPIDYTGGIGFQIYKNTAKISARGLDIELTTINTDGSLKWRTSLFANFYKDKTEAYYLGTQVASNFVNGSTIVSGIVGRPVYSIYAYPWAGLNPENGNPRGYVNGEVSEDYATITGAKSMLADLVYMGSAFPGITGGVANSFEWKGFNLDFRLAYKFGYYFRRSSLNYNSLYSQRLGHHEYVNRWQKSGDELVTNVPSAIYPAVNSRDNFYTFSEATIITGNHIRLQYIGVGYTFDRQKYKRLPFKQVQLRVVANNLGLLWTGNSQGVDPDYPTVVPTKNYSFNVQFSL